MVDHTRKRTWVAAFLTNGGRNYIYEWKNGQVRVQRHRGDDSVQQPRACLAGCAILMTISAKLYLTFLNFF